MLSITYSKNLLDFSTYYLWCVFINVISEQVHALHFWCKWLQRVISQSQLFYLKVGYNQIKIRSFTLPCLICRCNIKYLSVEVLILIRLSWLYHIICNALHTLHGSYIQTVDRLIVYMFPREEEIICRVTIHVLGKMGFGIFWW